MQLRAFVPTLLMMFLVPAIGFAKGGSKLPIKNAPSRGVDTPLVTIVAFEDYQCPYTKRAQATLEAVREKYPDVKIVHRAFPLPFHKNAHRASQAAFAAEQFGKFWEMHDVLFASQKEWSRLDKEEFEPFLVKLAKQIGLDGQTFYNALTETKHHSRVEQDIWLGKQVDVKGTPHFFVNGIRMVGAQPINRFQELIDSEIAAAKKKRESYDARVRKNYTKKETSVAEKRKNGDPVLMVPLRKDAAVLGSKKADVKVVVFGDYQCPFTKRHIPTLDALFETFGDSVHIEWRHRPLPFHKQAEEAAWAAEAARKQGKFWEMSRALFETQKAFKNTPMQEHTEQLAAALGLDTDRFSKDYASKSIRDRVADDLKLDGGEYARGTPVTYVNGELVVGSKPQPHFTSMIEAQLKLAKSIKKKHKLKGQKLYARLVKENKKRVAKVAKKDVQK